MSTRDGITLWMAKSLHREIALTSQIGYTIQDDWPSKLDIPITNNLSPRDFEHLESLNFLHSANVKQLVNTAKEIERKYTRTYALGREEGGRRDLPRNPGRGPLVAMRGLLNH